MARSKPWSRPSSRQLAERRAGARRKGRSSRYDAERDLALAQAELERLEDEKARPPTRCPRREIKIESYPTPLSKMVDGKEAHFQLLRRPAGFVPFEAC